MAVLIDNIGERIKIINDNNIVRAGGLIYACNLYAKNWAHTFYFDSF